MGKLKYKYTYSYSYFDEVYYVTYNGVSGWIKDAATECDNCRLFTHLKDLKACKTMQYEECTDVVTSLPKNTIIPIKYVASDYDNWYYVEYNGKQGWVYQEAHDDISTYNVFDYFYIHIYI